tara:strand:+ start:35226 stop:35654 length:429 start_codon:yes stop_codon:yes gene_type:complete
LHPIRKHRLYILISILIGSILSIVLITRALSNNLDLFYSPSDILSSNIEEGRQIRIGGMVVENTLIKSKDTLEISFLVTDFQNSLRVIYTGILPDLFDEGAGVVAKGTLNSNKDTFIATEILAKHDENYMPPEVAKILNKKE